MDWYRKTTWSQEDEAHFFAKLNRARKSSRAQYLRIQAIELIKTQQEDNLDVAEKLLLKLLEDYPDENFQRSPTLNALGEVNKLKGNLDKAMKFYQQSIAFEKEYPNVQTQSYLDYSELIVKLNLKGQFDTVIDLIEPRLRECIFPIEKYKISALLSIIQKEKGNDELANYYRNIANENSKAVTSGLSYHKDLGLVKDKISWIEGRMNKK